MLQTSLPPDALSLLGARFILTPMQRSPLLRLFVYFYSRSLFLLSTPALQDLPRSSHRVSTLVVSRINSPAASFTQVVFICSLPPLELLYLSVFC